MGDKNGNVKVPNLFKVKDRPPPIPLIKQYLKRRIEAKLLQKKNDSSYSTPEVVEAVVTKIEYEPEVFKEEETGPPKLESLNHFDTHNQINVAGTVNEEVVEPVVKKNNYEDKKTPREFAHVQNKDNEVSIVNSVTPTRHFEYMQEENDSIGEEINIEK